MTGRHIISGVLTILTGNLWGLDPSAAQNQDGDETLTACDVLAAHPADRQRLADGVADEAIIPLLAVPACRKALAELGGRPRLHFQLGRALLADGIKEESAAAFQAGADAGSSAAWAYLGDAYQLGNGRPVDYEKALDAYKRADKAGFEPAAGLVEQLTFVPGMYAVSVIGQFYGRANDELTRLSKADDTRWITRSYIFAMSRKLMDECQDVVRPSTLVPLYTLRYGGAWTPEIDAQPAVSIYEAVGSNDGEVFLRRHGCEGLIAKHLFQSIDLFVASFKE